MQALILENAKTKRLFIIRARIRREYGAKKKGKRLTNNRRSKQRKDNWVKTGRKTQRNSKCCF